MGLKSLESRRWSKFPVRILKNKSPDYLFRIIPQRRSSYITRNADEIHFFKAKHNFYEYSFFTSTTIEWNNLDQDLENSESYNLFRSSILKFIRPSPNSFCKWQNIIGTKLVTKVNLGLSHLRERKLNTVFRIR